MLCSNKDVRVFLEKEVWVSRVQKLKSNLSSEAIVDQETVDQKFLPGRKSFLDWCPYD